jgi:hypothetical protein
MRLESDQETVKVEMSVWGGVEGRKWPKDGEEGSRKRTERWERCGRIVIVW